MMPGKGKRPTAAEETALLKELLAALRAGATLTKDADGVYTVVEKQPMEVVSFYDPDTIMYLDSGTLIMMKNARRKHIQQALDFLPQDDRLSAAARVGVSAYLRARLDAFTNDTETLAEVEARLFKDE
jgi:hypothetical protein